MNDLKDFSSQEPSLKNKVELSLFLKFGNFKLLNKEIKCLNLINERFIGIEIFDLFDEKILDNSIINNIDFKNINNHFYFEATIFTSICCKIVFNSNLFSEKTYIIANTLLKGFLMVGIIPLIDESTGYQYKRPLNELQHLLNNNIKKNWHNF